MGSNEIYSSIFCFSGIISRVRVVAERDSSGSVACHSTRAQIKEAERRLNEMGYWTGAVDGILDDATRVGINCVSEIRRARYHR